MIRRATATRFDRLATSGRNAPLMVAVELADGEEREVYLKPSGRPGVGIREAQTSCSPLALLAYWTCPSVSPCLSPCRQSGSVP